jgi:predicted NAD-dependent protein-ADP-ribosyltransferase YbiA (DUF1768 family)
MPEPLNVVSNSVDPIARMISNFAVAPFELDSRRYRSVESFWQGLKFSDEHDRRPLADLDGPQARSEGDKHGYGATVNYGGEDIVVGTSAHWRLMERACRAKFEQNAEAGAALLSTGEHLYSMWCVAIARPYRASSWPKSGCVFARV